MIIDNLKHLKTYGVLRRAFARAAAFLESSHDLSIGRHEIDGDELFVLRADSVTKLEADSVWEVHRTYGDIHVMLEGEERFGYAPIDTMEPSVEYDVEKDFELFTGIGDFITLRPGFFCIVGPDDVHMPGQAIDENPAPVKKLVFKWKV